MIFKLMAILRDYLKSTKMLLSIELMIFQQATLQVTTHRQEVSAHYHQVLESDELASTN